MFDYKGKVEVLSADYDNSGDLIFCNSKIRLFPYSGVIDEENELYRAMLAAARDPKIHKVVLKIGSTRQSKSLDRTMALENSNGVCSDNYRKLVEHIRSKLPAELKNKIEFDDSVVQDILPPGVDWDSLDEHEKIGILLWQTHSVAAKYWEYEVGFRFIDDRSSLAGNLDYDEVILEKLDLLFKTRMHLLPTNLKLSCNWYEYSNQLKRPTPITNIGTYQGHGPRLEKGVLEKLIYFILTRDNFNDRVNYLDKLNQFLKSVATTDIAEFDVESLHPIKKAPQELPETFTSPKVAMVKETNPTVFLQSQTSPMDLEQPPLPSPIHLDTNPSKKDESKPFIEEFPVNSLHPTMITSGTSTFPKVSTPQETSTQAFFPTVTSSKQFLPTNGSTNNESKPLLAKPKKDDGVGCCLFNIRFGR